MDDEALIAAYQAHKAAALASGNKMFTRRMAIHLADMADMRPMSLVWRLEKLGCLKRGSWDWFKANGGITRDHIAEVRGDLTNLVSGEPHHG